MSPLRRYRLLMIVAGLTSFSLWWDFSHLNVQGPQLVAGGPRNIDPYVINEAVKKKQIGETLAALYPNRPETLIQQGLLAERMNSDDLAREYFERAIATGDKSSEELYYEYVAVLIRLKAPKAEIDAAAEKWRRLFPLSKIPDPRSIHDEAGPEAPRKKMWIGD